MSRKRHYIMPTEASHRKQRGRTAPNRALNYKLNNEIERLKYENEQLMEALKYSNDRVDFLIDLLMEYKNANN